MFKAIKALWFEIRHAPFITYWALLDWVLMIWSWFQKINYVGRYIYIISNSEQKFYFGGNYAAYGYSGLVIIKLGLPKQYFTYDLAVELLNHEVLHQVINKIAGSSTSEKLDNIHKSSFKNFCHVIDFII